MAVEKKSYLEMSCSTHSTVRMSNDIFVQQFKLENLVRCLQALGTPRETGQCIIAVEVINSLLMESWSAGPRYRFPSPRMIPVTKVQVSGQFHLAGPEYRVICQIIYFLSPLLNFLVVGIYKYIFSE